MWPSARTGDCWRSWARNGRITLWNARTLRSAGELRGLRADSQALAFSPDGRLLAPPRPCLHRRACGCGTSADASSLASGAIAPSGSLAFSPDGRWVAAENGFGADVLDARSGRLVKSVEIEGASRSVAFSPDGSRLVIGSSDGTIHFFSTGDWSAVGRPFEAHAARVTLSTSRRTAGCSPPPGPTGRLRSGTWRRGSRSGHRSTLEPGASASAVFSPDGSHLFAVSTGGEGLRLDASPEAWKRHACLVAGRDLSAREWDDALPERPYRAVCSGD